MPSEKNPSKPAEQAAGILIQQAPGVVPRRTVPLCLLTLHPVPEGSRPSKRELSPLIRNLGQIRRRFVLHYAAPVATESLRELPLPSNVEILDAESVTADGFLYHGRKLLSWWDYVKKHEVPKKRELAPTEAAVIRVLNFIRSNEDVCLISQAVKQDPALLHGLLRYINSAKMFFNNAYGGFRSIEQAIIYMGYRQFSKWLSLYLLHSSVEGSIPVLYHASSVRAQMMEALAKAVGIPDKQRDAIFITGVFSLLDEITGVPMETILQSLELDSPVSDALLERKGPYAPLLKLACASDSGSTEEMTRLIDELGIGLRANNKALLTAIELASNFD